MEIKNTSPILDTRAYRISFSDGSRYDLAMNVIVDHLFNSVSEDGYHHTYLDSIVDIKSTDNVISKNNGHFITPFNIKRRVITTKGWETCVKWKGGSLTWIPMEILKTSNPVEMVEFAISKNIQDELEFA